VFGPFDSPAFSYSSFLESNYQIQQQFEIYTITKNSDLTSKINLTPHPNTTAGLLNISIDPGIKGDLSYALFTSEGEQLFNLPIKEQYTRVIMKSLPSSIYYLRIFQNGKELKAYKIVKNR